MRWHVAHDVVCDVVLEQTTTTKHEQTFDILNNKSTRPIQAAGVTQYEGFPSGGLIRMGGGGCDILIQLGFWQQRYKQCLKLTQLKKKTVGLSWHWNLCYPVYLPGCQHTRQNIAKQIPSQVTMMTISSDRDLWRFAVVWTVKENTGDSGRQTVCSLGQGKGLKRPFCQAD